MHTDNFNFLCCANNQPLHGILALIGNFWAFWGPNKLFLGLKLGFKIGISSTHVYLQVSFSMFYSQCIPLEILANEENFYQWTDQRIDRQTNRGRFRSFCRGLKTNLRSDKFLSKLKNCLTYTAVHCQPFYVLIFVLFSTCRLPLDLNFWFVQLNVNFADMLKNLKV